MAQYIDKDSVIAKIARRLEALSNTSTDNDKQFAAIIGAQYYELANLVRYINTLEAKTPYEQCIQYQSIEDGIKALAEIYAFNTDSELFNQLTKEQQELWRKEINQACISGGHTGVELARDVRYKENIEAKEVDLERAIDKWIDDTAITHEDCSVADVINTAKHFFELGLKAQKGE